jgi:hypothetical protein
MVRPPLGRLLLAAALLLGATARPARAGEDPLDTAKSVVELGKALIEAGLDLGDSKRIRDGMAKLKEGKALFEAAAAKPGLTEAQVNRIRRHLVDVEATIEWYAPAAERAGKAAPGGKPGESKPGPETGDAEGEVHAPDPERGRLLGAWCREQRALYGKTEDPVARAALAGEMAAKAGVIAVPTLLELFRAEETAAAEAGVHEALATVGTSRVAAEMGAFARADAEARWDDALDVIYRALEKPEKTEPERPWCRAIRRFHELKERKLTLSILARLDAMGTPGIAALGEVIYVEDFGYHDYTIALLSKKRDRRAVPPLVYKMNRFQFDYFEQMPAHKALLEMGWYAVPELVDRLDDKAAGIWISWTLRKISGETMGTDKRKWGDWWKNEKIRHPELFEDPDERPPVVTAPEQPK